LMELACAIDVRDIPSGPALFLTSLPERLTLGTTRWRPRRFV
jgi:hypothetical protein